VTVDLLLAELPFPFPSRFVVRFPAFCVAVLSSLPSISNLERGPAIQALSFSERCLRPALFGSFNIISLAAARAAAIFARVLFALYHKGFSTDRTLSLNSCLLLGFLNPAILFAAFYAAVFLMLRFFLWLK